MTTGIESYGQVVLPDLSALIKRNEAVLESLQSKIVDDVLAGKSLFVFGSGHAGLFPLEMYHRAGGASFVVPVIAENLLPTAGPSWVRALERTPQMAHPVLDRARMREGEMIWIASQSGINPVGVEMAIEAKRRGHFPVAFTSISHSSSQESRHSSKKRLFEVCDAVVDLGGVSGDARVGLSSGIQAGPFSSLALFFLGHSLLVSVCEQLESKGHRCVYTSVNTPEGEKLNRELERIASLRDFRLP